MNDISIGAVGTAIIAGLISLLGLIIGKEQKVSEFRQAWIDELRKCLVAYLVQINAIVDMVRLKRAGKQIDDSALLGSYKALNEANHGIALRVNPGEKPSQDLLEAMKQFEALAGDNSNLTPVSIKNAEIAFLEASKRLLKYEWRQVKRGERTYVWTRRIVIGLIVLLLAIAAYLWSNRGARNDSPVSQPDITVIDASSVASMSYSGSDGSCRSVRTAAKKFAKNDRADGRNSTARQCRPDSAAPLKLEP